MKLAFIQKILVWYRSTKGPKDWRIRAKARVAKDSAEHKKGTPLFVVSVSRIPRGTYFIFPEPSASGLFFNQSLTAAKKAAKSRRKIKISATKFFGVSSKEIHHKYDRYFYDFCESMMVSIVTAFQALEYYCNDQIHAANLQNFPIPRGKKTEPHNSEEIERFCSIKTKLDTVLPHVKKVKTFKGTKLWQDIDTVITLRDRLVHLKGEEVSIQGQAVHLRSSIFYELLFLDLGKYIHTTLEVIKYFQGDFDGHAVFKRIEWEAKRLESKLNFA